MCLFIDEITDQVVNVKAEICKFLGLQSQGEI